MNNFLHRAHGIAFFYAFIPRIICTVCAASALGLALERFFFVLNLRGRVAGGFEFWRGRVLSGGVGEQGGGGVDTQKGGGANGGLFRQAAARGGLLECLPTHAKSGGALRGAGVEGGESGKEGGHGSNLINQARGQVVVKRGGAVVQYRLPLCQRVVDGPVIGQLHLPIAAA